MQGTVKVSSSKENFLGYNINHIEMHHTIFDPELDFEIQYRTGYVMSDYKKQFYISPQLSSCKLFSNFG